MEIREATDADWPLVWPVFEATVQAGETYAFDPDMPEDVARSIWMERPPGHTVVAVADGELLGTAKMGPNRGGVGLDDRVELDRAVALAPVPVHDVRRQRASHAAVALWRSLGFTIVGTVPEAFDHPEHGYVGLHVMHLPLV